jgi:hypothetical protein
VKPRGYRTNRCTLAFAALLYASAAFAGTATVDGQAPDAAPGSTDPSPVTLRYRAFVAGAPVGEAEVNVSVINGFYQIEGDARSNGWLKGFTRWRNRFAASGSVAGLVKEPAEFTYTESDRDKHRHVIVRDGTMQVTKNGKERPERPSPAAPDVVSALFVAPHCQDDQVLHTGRHVYRLSRIDRDVGGCRYTVVDDDGDTFEIDLDLGSRGGLVVPRKITFYAWLTGWVELTEATSR